MEVKEQVRTDDPLTGTTYVRQTDQRVVEPEVVAARSVNKTNRIIKFIVGLIDVLLALRILFLLFGGKGTGFAASLYSLTSPLAAPFAGIFPAPQAGGSYFDVASLVAIIIYSLIGWGLMALLNVTAKPANTEVL